MKLNSLIKGMVLSIPFLLASCSNEEQAMVDNKCRVVCSVDKFESESLSRTNTDPENGFLITWASGDVIGIFPREGYQEPFEIPADQVGNKSASFDGGYWDVKDGLQYNAYYPFDKRNFDSADMKTKIPVTYVGQKQNGTSCDIGAFDYTYSDWGTAVDGKIGFDFHHIGAISVFSLKYPATTTYTRMTLSVDDALIPLEGSYDLTAEEVSFVANESSMAESITLTLENCSGVAGETGVFYMMLPPMMDLSNNVVTLSLTSAAGTICTYSIDKALNTKSGKLYRRTGIPIDSKVEGTVDGWVEDEEDATPYITFTAASSQTLTMSKAVDKIQYSVGGGEWVTLGTTTVTFGGGNGDLRLRGKNLNGTQESTVLFGNETPVACMGDIRTLLDYENYATVDTEYAKFQSLFSDCSSLTSAPSLPATALTEQCYSWMFSFCSSLNNAPALPATILAASCYDKMFNGCTSLTTAPALPAPVLAESCYNHMFYGCTSLITAPALLATTLAKSCYAGMFNGCTSLTTAPVLPATMLTVSCYAGMFYGCTSLTTAPVLPATMLATSCYNTMFNGCTSLTTVPALPATTLADYCYFYMFYGCKKLNEITMLATNISASNCLNNWLTNVSSTGTFTKAKEMTSLPTGSNGIPTGWSVNNYGEEEDTTPYLTFTAASTQTLSMSKSVNKLQYSVGGGEWATLGTTTVTFGGGNGDLRLRGKNSYGTATDDTNYSQISFGNDVPVACGGDIRTLIDYENYSTVNTGNARFCCLFYECSNLIKAPALPSEALADKCYYFMFRGCESLTEAPSLPATALAESCYGYMFRDCKNLTKVPILPATILAERCYEDMFDGCKSLTESPLLPAETLAAYCYNYMFYGCESLETGPLLPAKTLKEYCYSHMFNGCKTLNAVTMLATNINASNCLNNWMGSVSSAGTFTKAEDMSSLPSGTSGIPSGWTVVDYEE